MIKKQHKLILFIFSITLLFLLLINSNSKISANTGLKSVADIELDCGNLAVLPGLTILGPEALAKCPNRGSEYELQLPEENTISPALTLGSVGENKCDKNSKLIVQLYRPLLSNPVNTIEIPYQDNFTSGALSSLVNTDYADAVKFYINREKDKNASKNNIDESCNRFVQLSQQEYNSLKGIDLCKNGNKIKILCRQEESQPKPIIQPPVTPPNPTNPKCKHRKPVDNYYNLAYLTNPSSNGYLGRYGAHKGADTFTPPYTPIYSPYDWGEGTVTEYLYWFTPPWGNIRMSSLLVVYYPKIGKYVGYGEIAPSDTKYYGWQKSHYKISPGTQIGNVGPNGMNEAHPFMLHLEMYNNYPSWDQKTRTDPTPYLNDIFSATDNSNINC